MLLPLTDEDFANEKYYSSPYKHKEIDYYDE